MDNIDEKIAKLKMQQRLEKEKQQRKESEEENLISEEEKLTIEEVMKQVDEGSLNINNTNFKFERKMFLSDKLEIPIPLVYFEERVNTDKNTALVNDNDGVSFTLAYVDKGAQKQSFAKFKKGMEKNFKDMDLYLEWMEEGELGEGNSKIFYGTYKTPTGRGNIYNLIFYREYKGTLIIGNYNCFERDIKTWELIMKASMMLMKIR
ncbi:hypothetical protein OD350_19220 [Clostridium beijerinckii]|uniref:hypothetical protein n=1 Tax=Clostridium beijerinckii TaxID=1520 RepID=UPI00156DD763|nr:hypothetical protein [Clostridium beijerinckii]NRT37144.1 hypothetical protein [Clostridium beijerinckii]NRT43422.1 hypothetical protein [Clostridium beijerinckii]NRZ22587.1 hypothetical protein [Clostridium beijerinckii]UYZ34379.1 hypothetical protein OD350_19220 [Clostridium beijerinckii]